MTTEAAPTTVQEVIALHNSSAWMDKPGFCNGSFIRCACGWEADCEGHDGTTRRALWPQHVADELAAIGLMSVGDALRSAARDLRALKDDGPYLEQSGQSRDAVGNPSTVIDGWYASWLERRAHALTRRSAKQVQASEDHAVPPTALRSLKRFLGVPSSVDA